MQDDALAAWLALRERADRAARSGALTGFVARALATRQPVRLLDLATGTGSNIRCLAAHLGPRQCWLAVDRSASLLDQLRRQMASWAASQGYEAATAGAECVIRGVDFECRIETRQADLAVPADPGLFAGRDLVTASALLDLVSPSWLETLAARCRAVDAWMLFTLTYDGRSTCVPADPEDGLILELFNRHQAQDKGLGGPAAGPGAVRCAAGTFAAAGYGVRRERSDWTIGEDERALQRQLIEGWAGAAVEVDPARTQVVAGWLERRLAHVEAGRSRVTVGHEDLAAWPPDA